MSMKTSTATAPPIPVRTNAPDPTLADSESLAREDIDVFLFPTKPWKTWEDGAYKILTDQIDMIEDCSSLPAKCCTFRLRDTKKFAYAFEIPAKRLDVTALVTKRILHYFSGKTPDHGPNFRVDRMIMLGFCGTLKAEEFPIGDIGLASQVDCYMEKAKIAKIKSIDLCGEVYRTTLEYVRIAQNAKYVDPEGYNAFIESCLNARRSALTGGETKNLTSDRLSTHTPHLASATLLSTSRRAVQWLTKRDRKLLMLDMESGGMMVAVWHYNQANPSNPVKTIVIRSVSDFTDERRDFTKDIRSTLQRLAFENSCRFAAWIVQLADVKVPRLLEPPRATQVAIIVPLEEEFGYFREQLNAPSEIYYSVPELRFYYSFPLKDGRRGMCSFVGDMGLAQMALATNAILDAFPSIRLVVLIGVAGSLSKKIFICDVAVATAVDPFLQGAETEIQGLAPDQRLFANEALLTVIEEVFDEKKVEIRASYRVLRKSIKKIPDKFQSLIADPNSLQLHRVPFASSDAVAANAGIHKLLRAKPRGNSVVDMESSGVHVAVETKRLLGQRWPLALCFRGISDNASSDKTALDSLKPEGVLRKVAMKNASLLVLRLLGNDSLWKHISE